MLLPVTNLLKVYVKFKVIEVNKNERLSSQYMFLHSCHYFHITVKFLIVAASPIEAAPQTFKKLQFFYKMFPTLKTSN